MAAINQAQRHPIFQSAGGAKLVDMWRRKRRITPARLCCRKFAGAAQELKSALIVNPYNIEATAAAIARAV
jgi:hypothetical protein